MQSFVKIKHSRNDEITLSFTDVCKSGPGREFLTSQICLLTLFAKIRFSQKFPNFVCLFDLVLYAPSTIFELNRDGSSWVEPVLS